MRRMSTHRPAFGRPSLPETASSELGVMIRFAAPT